MMEVDKLVLSAYDIAIAREVRTVKRKEFGFRGKSVDTDDDDDDCGGWDALLVHVCASVLEEKGNELDVLTLPLLTGRTMKDLTFPKAQRQTRRKRTKTCIPPFLNSLSSSSYSPSLASFMFFTFPVSMCVFSIGDPRVISMK